MTRPGFTLIELLVAISIIALLAAMIMPGIKLVLESSRAARCISNLRQIKSAADLYAADWEGYTVPSYYEKVSPIPDDSAVDLLTDYIIKSSNSKSDNTVWTCPSRAQSPKQWPLTYGFNTNVHSYVKAPTYLFFHQSIVKRSSEVVELADAAQASGSGTSSSYLQSIGSGTGSSQRATLIDSNVDVGENDDSGGYTVRYRHNRNTRVNLLYVDGHGGSSLQYILRYGDFAVAY